LQKIILSAKELIEANRQLKTSETVQDELEGAETPTPSPSLSLFEFDEKSIEQIESIVQEVETWLKETIKEQNELELWEEPVLFPSDLDNKGAQIQSIIRRVLLGQRKAQEKSKASAKSASQSTSVTEDAETTSTESAAPEETADEDEIPNMDEENKPTTTEEPLSVETESASAQQPRHEEL
jgi:hypothetical protein